MGFNEILSAIQELPKAERVELIKKAIDIINVDEEISPELLASLQASREEYKEDTTKGAMAHDFLRDRMKKALSHGV